MRKQINSNNTVRSNLTITMFIFHEHNFAGFISTFCLSCIWGGKIVRLKFKFKNTSYFNNQILKWVTLNIHCSFDCFVCKHIGYSKWRNVRLCRIVLSRLCLWNPNAVFYNVKSESSENVKVNNPLKAFTRTKPFVFWTLGNPENNVPQ